MRVVWMAIFLVGCIPHLTTNQVEVGPWEAPENSWKLTDPPEGLLGVGYEDGMVVPDFRLKDQFGDEVSLWQFYGDVVVLDISTMWCAPCQTLAEHTQATASDYADQGFTYITVLHENRTNDPPTKEDLNIWVDAFAIEQPVLSDGDLAGTGGALNQGSYPAVLVINRDMTVADRVTVTTDEAVRQAVEDAL